MSQVNQNKRRRRGSKRVKRSEQVVRCEVTIAELGHQGDGIAAVGEETIFVPLSAPGDRLLVDKSGARGTIVEVLQASDVRREPPCQYFGRCGGCALQHITPKFEDDFKRRKLASILERHGVTGVALSQTVKVSEGSRRRATFSVSRSKNKVAIGFQARQSHEQIDIESCTILVPQIVDSLPGLRDLLLVFMKNGDAGKMHVTAYDNGLDVDMTGLGVDPFGLDFEKLDKISEAGQSKVFARISFDGQSYLTPEAPFLLFGQAKVTPPPSAFLQASVESQAALQKLVVEVLRDRVKKNGRVADFFAGCGTFSFVMAESFNIEAFDNGKGLVDALKKSAENTPGLQNLSVENRDLYRRPLQVKDLKRFDAAVLDPPRAGAKDQVEQLAASDISLIIYVSCDPATFARDCQTLINGGYEMTALTPVDQFKYSAHLECVGILQKKI